MIVRESTSAWEEAARIISAGGLVVFPTDTVYGIGCNPYNVAAIEAIFDAKSRSHLKALPLLVADLSVVVEVSTGQNTSAQALAKAFWPGALTLVLPKAAALPEALGGGDTIAVRVPDQDGLRGMIALCGGAIAATSANISGLPDALNAEEAAAYLESKVQLIIDGGQARGGIPSTVVNCSGSSPTVLRAGAISEEAVMLALTEGL